MKPPESISALHGFSQIVQTLCDSRAQFFKNYIPGSQKFISLIYLNLLRCRCKNSKRFSNFGPPQLPRRSSANIVFTCKTLERSVNRFSCVTEVARDVFSRQKELYVV